jgi:hypothetical protein
MELKHGEKEVSSSLIFPEMRKESVPEESIQPAAAISSLENNAVI